MSYIYLDFEGLLGNKNTVPRSVKGALQVDQWQRIHLPMQEPPETRVPSRSSEDPLEKEMATHSSILARIIPWTEEPDGL